MPTLLRTWLSLSLVAASTLQLFGETAFARTTKSRKPAQSAEGAVHWIGVLEDAVPQVQMRALALIRPGEIIPVTDPRFKKEWSKAHAVPKVSWKILTNEGSITPVETTGAPRNTSGAGRGVLSLSEDPPLEVLKPVDPPRLETLAFTPRTQTLLASQDSAPMKGPWWEPSELLAGERALLLKAFRNEVRGVAQCDNPLSNRILKKSLAYQNDQIRIDRVLSLKDGSRVVSLRLDPSLYRCAGGAGDAWLTQWFHVGKKQVRFLGRGLSLVGGVRSEGHNWVWIFSAQNSGSSGYWIYWDRFRKSHELAWSPPGAASH